MASQQARRPLVGIPTQTLQSLGGVSSEIPTSWVMSQRYIVTLAQAGALPVMIPLVDDDTLRGIYERLDAVFLPGGADIDARTYGENPHRKSDTTDRERDRVEVALARWAIDESKPILGVCRGLQLINVAAGGTLYQDLADEFPGSIKHDYFPFNGQGFARDYLAHEVSVAEGTRLAQFVGAGALKVNSMHHQGIRELGRGLVATAEAPDGLIEALEGQGDSYLVAVQWHPEALTDNDHHSRELFADFTAAGAAWKRAHD
ncbi:MAG: gamma-glutamyl-gamma-aminobutyrate hydrolase family protein [bacterium]